MSPPLRSFRTAVTGVLACALTLLAGCLHEKLAWSPDGSRAAVITSEGLYLSDAAGTLSPLLVPGAYQAAWCADSQRLVVARKRPVPTYKELAQLLGAERTRALATKAEAVWQPWDALPDTVEHSPDIKVDSDSGAIALYLREHHRDRLKVKLAKDWKEVESMSADWHSLQVVRIDGEALQVEATLVEGLAPVSQIRPSPKVAVVAFVSNLELSPISDESNQLYLAPLDASKPPVLIAGQTSGFPDWTSTGRTLLTFRSASRALGSDELRLGTLSAFPVVDADGRIAAELKADDLAGLIFHDASRVRSLRDGRALFNAAEFNLPLATDERDIRDEFFVIDPAAHRVSRLLPTAVLAPLPKSLAHFELSPDETQILVGDDNGKVWLITLTEPKVETVCEGFGKGDSIAPVWRGPGDFTYRKPAAPRHDLIQRTGGKETVLSRTWPAEVLIHLVQ